MPAPRQATYTKTCEHCGRTYERKRHANGCLENSRQWATRRACGSECGNEIRKRTLAKRREHLHQNYEHPPCTQCDGPVERRPDEAYKRYRQRLTCSLACRATAMARPGLERNTTGLKRGSTGRKRKAKLANDGYVFNGKFPTPASIRSSWVTVTGPDTGCTAKPPSRATRSPTTLAALQSAVLAHPDLGTALIGELSDSWTNVEFSG